MATNFVAKIAKFADHALIRRTGIPKRIGIPQRRGRVNSCNDPSTSCESLVSFGPVTPEFTRLECVFIKGQIVNAGSTIGNARPADLVTAAMRLIFKYIFSNFSNFLASVYST